MSIHLLCNFLFILSSFFPWNLQASYMLIHFFWEDTTLYKENTQLYKYFCKHWSLLQQDDQLNDNQF